MASCSSLGFMICAQQRHDPGRAPARTRLRRGTDASVVQHPRGRDGFVQSEMRGAYDYYMYNLNNINQVRSL
jgi:hypothetical protein